MDLFSFLSCPECGINEYPQDDIGNGDNLECPECGFIGDLPVARINEMTSAEELEEVAGTDLSYITEGSDRERRYSDAEEVSDGEIAFIEDESYYKAGYEVFNCPACSEACKMSCGVLGRSDVAYCEKCQYQYTRSREGLVDDVHKGTIRVENRTEREAYEEYDCKHCDESHPYTKPEGEYKKPESQLQSHEMITLPCPCGEVLGANKLSVGDVVDCPNCHREYGLRRED